MDTMPSNFWGNVGRLLLLIVLSPVILVLGIIAFSGERAQER